MTQTLRNFIHCQIPGSESQKIRASAPNNARNNMVNVASQWNAERWQHQQHQQRQQQLYAAASSSAASPVRPSIPPISVAQFYPPNCAVRNHNLPELLPNRDNTLITENKKDFDMPID